jgi:hypothetical protein
MLELCSWTFQPSEQRAKYTSILWKLPCLRCFVISTKNVLRQFITSALGTIISPHKKEKIIFETLSHQPSIAED